MDAFMPRDSFVAIIKNIMNATKQIHLSIDPGWFKSWFDSSFYHQLYSHRDEKEAAEFIEVLLNELEPEPGSTMLDLGCGVGRHARQLASNGYNVTGLDLAASSIRNARRTPAPGLQFYEHDMRSSFGTGRFNYVFSFFTSFGYFNHASENHKVIKNISEALTSGGRLVMDYLNVSYAEQHLEPHEEKEIDGVVYDVGRWHDATHFYKKIVINGQYEFSERVEKLSIADFEYLFHSNGLRLKKVFGDYQLNGYMEEASPRLIMVAEKHRSL
jgi:cyclopropane fatty-acyl-phospholipid synthase-like methyltransferase